MCGPGVCGHDRTSPPVFTRYHRKSMIARFNEISLSPSYLYARLPSRFLYAKEPVRSPAFRGTSCSSAGSMTPRNLARKLPRNKKHRESQSYPHLVNACTRYLVVYSLIRRWYSSRFDSIKYIPLSIHLNLVFVFLYLWLYICVTYFWNIGFPLHNLLFFMLILCITALILRLIA